MDTKENLKSMYIKDSKDVKYSAYSHEISFADLYVQRKQKRTLKLSIIVPIILTKIQRNQFFQMWLWIITGKVTQ